METNSSRDPNGCRAEGNPLSTGNCGSLLNRSARQHRTKRPSAEDVHMEVRHLLPGVKTRVREQPIAAVDEPHIARDLADSSHESGDFVRGSLRRKIIPGDIRPL